MLFTPPVTNCHTFSDPLTPSSVTYFMDGPYSSNKNTEPRQTSRALDKLEEASFQFNLEDSLSQESGEHHGRPTMYLTIIPCMNPASISLIEPLSSSMQHTPCCK